MKKVAARILLILMFFAVTPGAIWVHAVSSTIYGSYKNEGVLPPEITSEIVDENLLSDGIMTGDGYLKIRKSVNDTAENSVKESVIVKFDLAGKVVWEKEFLYDYEKQTIENITATDDGGFLFTVSSYIYGQSHSWTKVEIVLIKCNKNGDILWRNEYDKTYAASFIQIAETETGDILIIGNKINYYADTDGYKSISIHLLKLDSNGKKRTEKTYGGSSGQNTFGHNAEYIDHVGFVALISSQTTDGPFAVESGDNIGSFMIMFNSELGIAWLKKLSTEYYSNEVCILSNGIYLSKAINTTDGKTTVNRSLMTKIDFEGNILWENKMDSHEMIKNSSKEPRIALIHRDEVNSATTKVITMDAEDCVQEISLKLNTRDWIQEIFFKDDYFIAISIHLTDLLTLHGPLDGAVYARELVYSGYDYQGRLLWRRVSASLED
ncbi:MAG: hypothetical protein ACYC5K_13725 [Saccharofermentanales bacterium]